MSAHGRVGAGGGGPAAGMALVLGLAAVVAAGPPQRMVPPGVAPQRTPSAAGNAPNPMASDLMRQDARLHDVCFRGARLGWAVGDRGAVWHTDDGGRHWYLQHSGVACPLRSVFFLDERTGWAVGGTSHPYTHTSSAVVLATRDGGRTWHRVETPLLPALVKVRFFDAKQGWAVGCASAATPTGLFTTSTGGRSWKPIPGDKSAGWTTGDFLQPLVGALAGRDGRTAVVRPGHLDPSRTPPFGSRGLGAMTLVPPLYGWLVGQGGLVMMTRDLGVTWQTPPAPVADAVAGEFDFSALAVLGAKVWVAGSPGTKVFHTPDAGLTWIEQPTHQSLPLRAIQFVDDRRGWAVGDLGTILATDDGGTTWRRQHAGGTRAALVAFFRGPRDVPWEALARLSGNEGYLGVVDILAHDPVDPSARAETPIEDRLHEATVAVGASGAETAWRFPLPARLLRLPREQIIDGWSRANDAPGLPSLEAHLVRQIRLWRPDLILTHDVSPTGDDPAADLLSQAVLAAVPLAADPTAYADQITRVGLEPWKVKKVYAAVAGGMHGQASVSGSQLATRLGKALDEITAGPRGLVDDQLAAGPENHEFRVLLDHVAPAGGRQDFFTGIVLHPGGEARRALPESPPGNLEAMKRIAQRRRNTRAILHQAEGDSPRQLGLLAQAREMTAGLDADSSARIIDHLARQYRRSGQWAMAAETFKLLVDRHPGHPLSRSALEWLVQYYASDEAAWRVHGSQRYSVVRVSKPAIDPSQQENRPELAAEWGRRMEKTFPAMSAQPAVSFALAVADRKRGYPGQANRALLLLQRSATHDAWWACAQAEEWLAKLAGVPAKPILRCVAAGSKPYLDGKLDDAVWQGAKRAELKSLRAAPDEPAATVMLAYDKEFLYLGVRCPHAPGVTYAAGEGPRPRDADLSARDRVEVMLDLDRDYATYYRLAVDQRGYPAEDCWGDPTWNPTWFVAAGEEAHAWTAEAAIPLDQLTGRFPTSGSVWAVGLRRITPGVGWQAWEQTATTEIRPQRFGLLIFD